MAISRKSQLALLTFFTFLACGALVASIAHTSWYTFTDVSKIGSLLISTSTYSLDLSGETIQTVYGGDSKTVSITLNSWSDIDHDHKDFNCESIATASGNSGIDCVFTISGLSRFASELLHSLQDQ
jgi:hypothetical protein